MKKILSVVLTLALIIGICPQILVSAATVPESLKRDYVAGEVQGNKYNVASEAIGTTLVSNSTKVGFSANLNGDMVFSSDQVIGDGIEAIEAIQAVGAQVATAYVDWTDIHVNGATFIVGAQVKRLSGTPRITAAFTEAPSTANPNKIGDRANGYAIDEGLEITSTEYAPVCLTMTMTEARSNMDWSSFNIGFPEDPAGTTSVEPRSFAMKPGSLFIGFEAAHDIEVSTVGARSAVPGIGGKINVTAKILNQVGTTGGLEQGTFSWYALNADRTEYVSGISVTAGVDGTATINISPDVSVGEYAIVAESNKYDGFIKGTTIYVGYKDYTPSEVPENLIDKSATAANLLFMNYNQHMKYGTETSTSMDVYVTEETDGSVTLTAQRDLGNPYAVYKDTNSDGVKDTVVEGEEVLDWAFSGAGTDETVLSLPAEKGALVYSFKVSNNNTAYTPKINFGRNKSPIYPAEYNGTAQGMSVLASGGKWQVFCGTIPADNINLNQHSYSIGLSEGNKKGTSVKIKADEMYFGIEEAYDIEAKVVGSDRVYVGQGGTISVDADIVNQIYSTGDLEQGEFLWYALDDDRTQTVEGISVAAGEDGVATVTVSADVPCGAYDIVASSKLYPGFVKGVRIYVVLPEDTAAEGLAQHVAQDFESSTAGFTTIGSTAEIKDGVLSVNVTSAGGMAKFPIRTEAGNKYNISAWVRADSNADNGYFVFTNKAIDGGSDVINEVPVNKSFTAGEWVYVTAEYTADGRGLRSGARVGALLSGTVGFRFGSGSTVSYAIEELFIFPEVDNKLDYDDVFTQGSFDTNACLNEWTVWANEGGSLTTEQKKTNGFSYDGYRNKPGALELDGIKMFDSIHPSKTVDIVYGRAYRMSFYAKALDDEAVGQPIWFYLGYSDKSGDGFDPVFNKFYHVNNGQNPTLTKEWQYFEIDFDYDFVGRNLAEMTMGFRVSDLQNSFLTRGGRPHYMIDEVSLKQIGGEDFVVDADTYGDVTSTEGATIKLNYVESTKGKFLYRIVRETSNGDYCIEQGFTEDEVLDFAYTEDLGEDKLRLDLIGTDAYGNYSQFYTMPIEAVKKGDKIAFEPCEYLWNDEIGTLSATLTYENNTELKDLNVYAALYTENNRLVALNKAKFSPVVGEENEITISVDTTYPEDEKHPAIKAKFFAWYDDSNAPAAYADEIIKATGEFIYVDANSTAAEENGTYQAPFKTISAAVTLLESFVTSTDKENIYVVLKSGEYIQSEAIDLSDAATSGKNIIFTTLSGEKASISGAMHLSGDDFEPYGNGIYRAQVPDGTMSRQLYVNGIKATRARSIEDVAGFTNLDTTEASTFTNSGLSCTDTSYANYKYPQELELVFIENWCHYYIMPDSITESNGKALFTFTEEGNAAAWKRLMTERVLAPTVPVYLENALELLDEPGEWYLDTHENYLYYMPRSFEDIDTAEVILPVTEQLVKAEGTADNPVKNISFENIDFTYSAWNYPTENRYFLPTQALYYQNLRTDSWDGGDEIICGALQFNNVHNLSFDNCDFAHLGSNGLVLIGAVQNCVVSGNEFYEISGNAINLGEVKGNSFNPQEEKYFVTDNEISNNYIHKIADDYYSAAAIVVGYPKNTTIKNNEITDIPYCGIHAGWGWATPPTGGTENLVIESNYIHNAMNWRLYDGAPIYVMGRTSGTNDNPNLIRENYIADTKNPEAGIYPDDGSNYWKISRNVIDANSYPVQHYLKESQIGFASWLNVWTPRIMDIVIENNYSTTSHYRYEGSGGSFEQAIISPNADWNDDALAIIDKAGIEEEYLERFDFDIQILTLPAKLTLSVDAVEKLYYDAKSTKDSYCDLSDCEITVTSSNESVATATKDTVTAISEGKAWITYTICRKNADGEVVYYDKYSFCVVVE